MTSKRSVQIAQTILLALACLILWRTAVAASQPPEAGIASALQPLEAAFPEYDRQPVTRSSDLPLHDGSRLTDRDLAHYITTYLGISNCHSMKFVFGECHGGGMIDELFNAGITCSVSAQSAARHDECSYGNGSEDFYLTALAEILALSPTLSLEKAAKLARARDEVGPSAPLASHRLEHPQYRAEGPLSSTLTITGAGSFHAVLLAGDPDGARHWGDLKRWYHLLTSTFGYTAGAINVLYGDGRWPVGSDGDSPFPADPGIAITSATRENLTRTLERVGLAMGPDEQFFLVVSDHGGDGAVPTGTAGVGSAACSWESDSGCEMPMSASLSDAELARLNDRAALEFSYRAFFDAGPAELRVRFNGVDLAAFGSAAAPRQISLSLSPDAFLPGNDITFLAGPSGTGPGTQASRSYGFAQVTDVTLWFGERTTQLLPEYLQFLPLVLRSGP